MAFPPEPVMKRYLTFMHFVLVTGRTMARRGDSPEILADLIDAIHELPNLLSQWEFFNEETFLDILQKYDKKWPPDVRSSTGLVELWEKYSKQ